MGTEYEFEKDVKYNYESNTSMKLEINKTCYSKGEILKGSLFIKPKNSLNQIQLIDPHIEIKLEEMHYFQYNETTNNNDKRTSSITEEEEENITVLSENLSFPNYQGLNITLEGLKIPFEVKIPQTAYPSCIFESSAFVRHFFSVKFPSIGAKKTLVIVVKNNIHFSAYNRRLKSPLYIQKEISKHSFIFFDSGSFKFSITIPKNIFFYDEIIPFLIDLDCSNLSFDIRGIKVVIYRIYRLNRKKNHKIMRYRDKKDIISKYIYLTSGEKILHIEDYIKLPISPKELNPKTVYTLLDNERRNFKYKEKYSDLRLFPSCDGGLLTCYYIINFEFDMGSWSTTNEEFFEPLDFHERFTDYIETPKPYEKTPYPNTNDSNQNKENYNDELPNESELNTQMDNEQIPDEAELNTQMDNVQIPNESELNTQMDNVHIPDEAELNTQKENNTDNKDSNKSGDDNYKDDDAPPPSAG